MSSVPSAPPSRYLSEVQLTNIRGFAHLELHLGDESGGPRRRTLVIGKNGTCKSTLLRSLAIGLADRSDAEAMLASPIGKLIGAADTHGQIQLGLEGGSLLLSLIASSGDKEYLESHGESGFSPPFLVGYGAGRFSSGSESASFRGYRAIDAVAGLFNHPRPLADPELTLRRLQDFFGTARYDGTLLGLKRVLGLAPEDSITIRQGGGIELSGPTVGPPIGLEAWADGYRVTFTWLLDFYSWAMRAGAIDEDGVVRGILLIDEVDQHLHPSMQAQVLPRLAELLPEVQIIASTHSPLVALGAAPEELVALHRTPEGTVEVAAAPDFRLYSAEDMLTDDRLFATPPYSPEVNRKTEEYQELLEVPARRRGPGQEARLRRLARELTPALEPSESGAAAFEEVKGILAKHGIT